MTKLKKLIFLLIATTVVLLGCSQKTSTTNSSDKINVVTSVNFYAEVAQNILQDKGSVTSIIDNISVDPHDFEPTADDAKKIADANITIFNGGGYDSWFEKLTLNSKELVNIDAAKLINLKEGENEHIWYNPQVLKNVAEKLTEELIKKDITNKDFYEKNKNNYLAELNKIDEKIATLKEKAKDKTILTTEPVFDYAVHELGFKTTKEIESLAKATQEGNDPSPQVLKQIQEDIKNKKITLIVNNIQTTNKTIESIINIAEENNIPILNVSETKPNDKNYIEWMLSQYDQLEKILNGGSGEKAYHSKDAKETHHHHDHDHNHNHNHDHDHKKDNHNH